MLQECIFQGHFFSYANELEMTFHKTDEAKTISVDCAHSAIFLPIIMQNGRFAWLVYGSGKMIQFSCRLKCYMIYLVILIYRQFLAIKKRIRTFTLMNMTGDVIALSFQNGWWYSLVLLDGQCRTKEGRFLKLYKLYILWIYTHKCPISSTV